MSAATCSIATPGSARPTLPRWQRVPSVSFALIGVLFAFAFFPPVRDNPRLLWTFFGVGGALLAWTLYLWSGAKRWGQTFGVQLFPPLKSHYIQATVQICIYAYWGYYWREVYAEVPLILAQLVFLYVFDALISWSRGRSWCLGCGPLPIIFSTNVFLWFKDDWFIFQFALVAVGALGKEFIKWDRDGKKTHIFNPSAFTLSLFAVALLVTDTTDATWAGRIADTFTRPSQIYVVIFLLGLVVQFVFSTTLMTCSAIAMLCLLNFVYHAGTGTYWFIFSNIPAPVFLGLHLLVTDPSTSPRTPSGKVLFGALYGVGVFVFYGLLESFGAPTVYDKLLPVPLLNLSVRWIDRVTKPGALGGLSRWAAKLQPRKLNLVHMGGWCIVFGTMLGTGYVQAPHEGATYAFWKKALEEGRPNAAKGLFEVVKSFARDDSPAAWNELGMLYLEGKVVEKDPNTALKYFAKASKLGNVAGSANLVSQFLGTENAEIVPIVESALEQLETECRKGTDPALYYLVGRAYETGRGRPENAAHARVFFKEGCQRGSQESCRGLARVSPQKAPAR